MKRPYSTNLNIAVNPAAAPPEALHRRRDDVRLLVLDPTNGGIAHEHFSGLARYFRPGDVLVVNNSATIAASLSILLKQRPKRLHLAARLGPNRVIAELRQEDGTPDPTRLSTASAIALTDGQNLIISRGKVLAHFHPRSRLWVIQTDHDWYALANRYGLPIRYHYVDQPYPLPYYATIFGRVPGSSEMPSASRPFTQSTVASLTRLGVTLVELTLHTTVSSHEIDDTDPHPPLVPEWYSIPDQTRSAVSAAQKEGRAVIALGTTVVRALETWARTGHDQGWTTHLVTPDSPPLFVNGLVTGLHDNFTSHLWLLYAFVPPHHLVQAYRQAVERGYRWHEFGDLCFIRRI